MRLLISFRPERSMFMLPTNYNYEVSSLIYYIMSQAGPKFTQWLHRRGFSLDGTKRFKFFNFSRLYFTEKEIQGDVIKAQGNFRLLFSSPIDESIITNFVSGMMENSEFYYLGNKDVGTKIKISSVKILPYPKFERTMKYIMLSPTVVSVQNKDKRIVYLYPDNQKTIDSLTNNIVDKYEIIYMKKNPYEINLKFDEEYLNKKKVEEVMKLVTIKVNKENQAKLKGFMLPIIIEADPVIQKLIYETGIGEKNSLGFGMLEIAR